jgi:hypothetical protein
LRQTVNAQIDPSRHQAACWGIVGKWVVNQLFQKASLGFKQKLTARL